MVARINKTNKIEGTLGYNENKVEQEVATFLCCSMIDYDTSVGVTEKDIHNAFSERLKLNQRTKKPIVAISLNVHPDDVPNMDDYKWENIAEAYLKEMGYDNQPYVVYRHNDIKREHIHIITTDIDKYGKKVVNDKFYKIKSEMARRVIEERYNLIPADLSKSKKNTNKQEKVFPQKININQSIVPQIKNIVEFAKTYKYSTLGEFNAFLENFNVGSSIQYNDKKEVNGLLFFPMDSNGKRVGNSIKSSSLGNKLNYAAILKNATKEDIIRKGRNANTLTKIEQSVKKLFESIKNGKSAKNMFSIFKQEMEQKNINVVFRYNAQNRIYGVTFIDNDGKNIVNGSKLGKMFSANNFNNALKNEVLDNERDNIIITERKIKDDKKHQKDATNEIHENKQNELLDIWNTIYSGDYYKEIFSTVGHIQQDIGSNQNTPDWKKKKKKHKKSTTTTKRKKII
jgi:hypothetical protein